MKRKIVSHYGQRILVSIAFLVTTSSRHFPGSITDDDVLLEEKVTLDEAIDDLEVRIWVYDKADIFIEGYSLLPVAVPAK